MKKNIKNITSLLVICILMSVQSMCVQAVQTTEYGFDVSELGTIAVAYEYDDIALDNVEFLVYQITKLEDLNENTMCANYTNINIDETLLEDYDYWMQLSDEIENYINYNMISYDYTFLTDQKGAYRLDGLELGIYFVQATPLQEDGQEFFSEPILLMLGNYDEEEEIWLYHHKLKPKLEVVSQESYEISVQKKWENIHPGVAIVDAITVQLQCNGLLYGVVTLNEENNWSYTWPDIEPCDCWAIKELDDFEQFQVTYEKNLFAFEITNTYVGPPPEEPQKDVEKEDEEDDDYEEKEKLPQTGSYAYLIPICSSLGLILILTGILLQITSKREEDV